MNHIKVNDKQFCVVKNNSLLPPRKSGNKLHEQGNYVNKYSNCVPTSRNDYNVLPQSPVADGIVCLKNEATREIIVSNGNNNADIIEAHLLVYLYV
jgi:hypothetical protein